MVRLSTGYPILYRYPAENLYQQLLYAGDTQCSLYPWIKSKQSGGSYSYMHIAWARFVRIETNITPEHNQRIQGIRMSRY